MAHAAACTTATAACTEWLSIADGPQRTLLYRSHSLDARSDGIQRALIMIHGRSRNADGYFSHAMAAALLAGALENAIVIAPRFASSEGKECRDKRAADEFNWRCSGPERWSNGGSAAGATQITSYHVTDEILRRLARKDVFPNLRSIVVAGHSAGGQYATRYAMANQVHDSIGVSLRYVVANPSSYTYPDALRPAGAPGAEDVSSAVPDRAARAAVKGPTTFQPLPNADKCAGFDNWPYGMRKRVGYSAQVPTEQLIKQLTSRPTTFLVGEYDVLPTNNLDTSCSAMAQGPSRVARGLAYARYLNEFHGARHQAIVVPLCGHNARCMFTNNRILPVLFPGE